MTFETKDSGKRQDLANGMVRDVTEGKTDYTLILDGPLIERYAALLTRGAEKYGKRNWCKSFESPPGDAREETRERFRESAMRHFMQWLAGDRTEDHASAVVFNMNGYEALHEVDERRETERRCMRSFAAAFKEFDEALEEPFEKLPPIAGAVRDEGMKF